MKSIAFIIDSILRVKRVSQAEIAEKARIHRSNLSRFLSGEVDIRLSSLISILKSLDIELDKILEGELQKHVGQLEKQPSDFVQALELILLKSTASATKTALETLIASLPKDDKELETAISIVRKSLSTQALTASTATVQSNAVAPLIANKVI